MIDYNEILLMLQQMYKNGATFQEIANKTGISQPYIIQLISGKRNIEGLTLKKLNQLFPNIKMQLSPNINKGTNNGTINSVNSLANGTVINQATMSDEANTTAAIDKYQRDVLAVIMANKELPAEAKIIVYNIITNIKQEE